MRNSGKAKGKAKLVRADIFKSGHDAYNNGISLVDNPYSYLPEAIRSINEKRKTWRLGWNHAFKEGLA